MTPIGPASPVDTFIGRVFCLLYAMCGLVVWPIALAHPGLRRFVWRVPVPAPGWTWIHGASLGEHRAISGLVSETTETNIWRTQSSIRTSVSGAFPAPLDLPFSIGPWLDRARPGRLVLVEAELWPGWLVACRARGIPVVWINARVGRGTRRWQRLGPLWRFLMQDVRVIPQSETGDLKLRAPPAVPSGRLPPGAFIAASTRPGDEAKVLAAWKRLPAPRPLLVLAPRHLDRVAEVTALAQAEGWLVGRWSAQELPVDVLVLDTLGDLAGLMHGACGVFVGGTFDATIGGHSPAEAFAVGVGVVRGPYTHASPAAWRVGASIETNGTPEDFAAAMVAAQQLPRLPLPSPVSPVWPRLPPPVARAEVWERPALAPLVPVVRAIARRRFAWRGPVERPSVPVVSVGALVAGGAGKSPVAELLAHQWEGAWVLARGYRRGPGPAVRLGTAEVASKWFLGDELEMMRRGGLSVVSAPDRLAGAHAAIAAGATGLVLDDAFSHRRIHRDLDIVCIDARWPTGGGPIPVGTRREPLAALQRADVVWVHHSLAGVPQAPWMATQALQIRSWAEPDGWDTPDGWLPTEGVQGEVDVAVGIAREANVLCTLVRLGLRVRRLIRVPNHGSLPVLPRRCVVSAKDAARLPQGADVRVLRMRLCVDGPKDWGGQLIARLRQNCEARGLALGGGPRWGACGAPILRNSEQAAPLVHSQR